MALVSFQSPTGLVESTGGVALDLGRVLRHPGFRYWPITVRLAARLVKDAGPMAWLLCFFQGTFVVIQAASILGGFGVDVAFRGSSSAPSGCASSASSWRPPRSARPPGPAT